ncbi:MAG: HIT domain-containing protein [Bacilli bacterium]
MDCIFCKINEGVIPSYTIYEDNIVRVFLDIEPDSLGHLLIVPKDHTLDLNTIPNETFIHIIETARKMEKLLREKLNIDGLTLIQNNGDIQLVKHFHLHLKPYYNDNRPLMDIKEVYNILTK